LTERDEILTLIPTTDGCEAVVPGRRKEKLMKSKLVAVMFRNYFLRAASFLLLALAFGAGQSARAAIYTLSVPNSQPWYDTGIDIASGSQLNISALGIVQYGPLTAQMANANGGDYTGTQFFPTAVYPSTIIVSLIGKIGGTTDIGTGTPVPEGTPGNGPGFVGVSYNQPILSGGRLFLGYNDQVGAFGDNSGSFDVTLSVQPIPEPSAAALFVIGVSLFGWIRRGQRKKALAS
jgi:hypothetical protein